MVRNMARIVLRPGDTLIYRGKALDREVLDAVLSTNQRLLWAFVRGECGDIMAVPYSEDRVIWLAESDVQQPNDVEV